MEFDNRLGHANDEIRDEMNNYIAEPKQVTQETNVSCHKSFLELIIENEESDEDKMSDQDIRDNMITIMFAGQDTTATTNCLTLLMLALHPDIQTQVGSVNGPKGKAKPEPLTNGGSTQERLMSYKLM